MTESMYSAARRSQGYDYIICGAGCAGLSLLMHMIESGKFTDKKILLVDRERKNKNDRTWCFWETTPGLFENCVYKQWEKLWFHDTGFSKLMEIDPYRYKMIRGIDFYEYCFSVMEKQDNIEILQAEVKHMMNEGSKAVMTINNEKTEAGYIFNSILFEKPALNKNEHYLLQHFKGWTIETTSPVFNPSEATMMDFRVDQQGGTTFVYIMPLTTTKALVEYTLFTSSLLPHHQYDDALKKYITRYLKINDYAVTEEEFGIIPMTNHRFPGIRPKGYQYRDSRRANKSVKRLYI